MTRTGLDWTERFSPLADALAALDLPPALIDGEVALDAQGNPSSTLQAALKAGDSRPAYFAFDLLRLSGEDLKPLPNIERKERLSAARQAQPPIHVAEHIIGAGEKLLTAMCRPGRKASSPSAPMRLIAEIAPAIGSRSNAPCGRSSSCGLDESPARARAFGALLLGQMENGKLVYKGKVGTGFDTQMLRHLAEVMAPLAQGKSRRWSLLPRHAARGSRSKLLVAEIAFAQFTADGRVRHASFVGLRQDKKAKDVKPERPAPLSAQPPRSTSPMPVAFCSPRAGRPRAIWRTITRRLPADAAFCRQPPDELGALSARAGQACFFQKHDSGSFGPEISHVPITEKDGNRGLPLSDR
jgi:bifunctional non-homologous end joining protein LigD